MNLSFRDLSLRRKLAIIGVVSSLSAVALAGGASLAEDYSNRKREFIERNQMLAKVLAQHCAAALAFNDPRSAQRTLLALEVETNVRLAVVSRADGVSLATYRRVGESRIALPDLGKFTGIRFDSAGIRFDDDALHVVEPVVQAGLVLGTLYLQSDPKIVRSYLQRGSLRLLLFAFVASGLAAALTYRLQRSVSAPLLELADVAERVRGDRSWSLDPPPPQFAKDEIGRLSKSFYEMLGELRDRERALRESESNYRMLTEQASDGIVITDQEGRVLTMNQAALQLLGYQRDEARNLRIRDLIHPEDFEAHPIVLEDLLRGKAILSERRFLTKEGRVVWIETNTKVLEDGRIQSILRDLSERKRLEAELNQAQKMDAVGRLAGGIAHDFNNLLTVIGGFSENIVHDPDRDVRTQAEEIVRASQRAAELTRQLLAFSRQQILNPRVFDLTDTLVGLERMLARIIGEDVDLITTVSPQPCVVRVDPGQIEQVILNMVVNARDAMPNGGRLRMRIDNVEVARGSGSEVYPGAWVRLQVADEGEGIPPEVLPRIFDPFFTTKEAGKGTGLGLSTLYGIIKQSGGHIAVDSRVFKGTTFSIYLPRVQQRTESQPRAGADAPAVGGNESILLVEDESNVRKFTSTALQNLGYTVIEASGGEEALGLASGKGPLDLLLTDLIMPGMSGIELTEEIRRIRPGLPVLVISGYPGDVLERQQPPEDVEFLPKPFAIRVLARRLREILDHKSQMA